jgi:autophagy-related protein 16
MNFSPVQKLQSPAYRNHTAWSRVTFSPDGRWVAAGSGNGKVVLWNTGTGGVEGVLEAHESAVSCCAWDPAEGKLASADKKGNLMIWV